MIRRNNTSLVPTELEGIATTGDVSALGVKIEKCYSSERYEDFQEAVEKIVLRYLKGSVGWVITLWIFSVVGSLLTQKFFNIF